MADVLSILSTNYRAVGAAAAPHGSKYVNVDPEKFEGTWKGKYANNQAFTIQVSNVEGFRAKARYESGGTIKYQDVMIRDNSFRVADSKFTLTRAGTAQVKSVVTNPSTGAQSLETAYAKQN
jgi:hypothetical protein